MARFVDCLCELFAARNQFFEQRPIVICRLKVLEPSELVAGILQRIVERENLDRNIS